MKKIIIIIICFLCCACYDYKEINDLSFVSSIGITYDDKYHMIFEIIDNNEESYLINSDGDTIAEAMNNANLVNYKIPYYYHLRAVIIDENVAKNHMEEFLDYMVREIDIRNEFFLAVSDKVSEIINSKGNGKEENGKKISKLIETNSYDYNISYNKVFEDVFEAFENPYEDAITTYLTFENDEIKVTGLALFKDYQYVDHLTDNEASYLNILKGAVNNVLLKIKYNDNAFLLNIYGSKNKYILNNKNVTLKINAEGLIKENSLLFDLENENTYATLQKEFEKKLNDDISGLFEKLKELEVDPIGIRNMYYIKTRDNPGNIHDYSFNINTKIFINKKGLIFEVQDEK